MNRRPLPCVVRNLRPIPPTIELMPGVALVAQALDVGAAEQVRATLAGHPA